MRAVLPVLVLSTLLVSTASRAADAPTAAPDSAADAQAVLGSNDEAYAALRARIALAGVGDALEVLDAVRRARYEPFVLGFVPGPADAVAPADARALVAALGDPAPWTARVKAHVVRVPAGIAEALLPGVSPPREGGAVAISDCVARRLLGAASCGVEAMPLPSVDLLDGQQGTLRVGASTAYLQDYEVEIPPGNVADPVFGHIHEGVTLRCTPRRTARRGVLSLSVALHAALLRRPVELFRTTLAGGIGAVTIQLPELRVVSVHGAADLPSGGWALVGNDLPVADGAWLLALVQAVEGANGPPPR